VNGEPSTARDPAPAPADPERLRARNRRVLLVLSGLVVVLVLFTIAYVCLYDRVLRDPSQPPSVLAHNSRVLAFEIALAGCVLLVLGLGLFRIVKRRP